RDRVAVALEDAAGVRDDEDARQAGHLLVPVDRPVDDEWGAAEEVGQDRPSATPLEAEPQVRDLAGRAGRQLRGLVLVGGQLRRQVQGPHGFTAFRSRSKSTFSRIRRTRAGMPSLVLQLVNRNGLSPRISRESRSITSRLAPTYGARSILLITRTSDCVM